MAAEEAELGAALAEESARDRARWKADWEANRAATRSRRDAANAVAADLEARWRGKVERCRRARQETAIARAQQAIDDAAPRVERPWADVVAVDDDASEELPRDGVGEDGGARRRVDMAGSRNLFV
jgi:hypothetical protein